MREKHVKSDIPGTIMVIVLLGSFVAVGYNIGLPYKSDRELISLQEKEYQKCLSGLKRNQDCVLTGFIYKVTPNQE